MNERLLELADQVMEDLPGPWNIPNEFCKKFAELIVRECADIGDLYEGGEYQVRTQILAHFGVEG